MSEIKAEKWECTVEEGAHVVPCDTLASFVEGPAAFSRSKGIHVWAYRKHVDGKSVPSRTFYGFLGMGEHKKGFALNYCPFCGTRIDAPFGERDEPEAAA